MTTELLRKYLDIINENNESAVQLDEGLLDTIKQKVMQTAQRYFSQQDMEQMKLAVEKATGKSIDQVSFRDVAGNAVAISGMLGAKAIPNAQVNESQLNELFGIKSDKIKNWEKDSAASGYPLSKDAVKRQMDWDDYTKYGFTTGQLARNIMAFVTQFSGIGGLISAAMGGVPVWAGAIALIAFFVGSMMYKLR